MENFFRFRGFLLTLQWIRKGQNFVNFKGS